MSNFTAAFTFPSGILTVIDEEGNLMCGTWLFALASVVCFVWSLIFPRSDSFGSSLEREREQNASTQLTQGRRPSLPLKRFQSYTWKTLRLIDQIGCNTAAASEISFRV